MTLLFVYGTLRRGFANHRLLAGARAVGAGRTVARLALHVGRIPYLAAAPAVHQVRGEVYAVDAATLAAVDLLEGHPRWYERRAVDVMLDAGSDGAPDAQGGTEAGAAAGAAPAAGPVLRCEAYFNDRPSGALSATGDYAQDVARRRRRR